MNNRFSRTVCSLGAAVALIGLALFTSGCAVSDDAYYGGGVYSTGWGDPFYGGYYGGYYGGGGYYPGRPGYNPGNLPPHIEHHGSWGPGSANVRPTPYGGGGRMGGGGGRMGGGGRR